MGLWSESRLRFADLSMEGGASQDLVVALPRHRTDLLGVSENKGYLGVPLKRYWVPLKSSTMI